MALRLLGCLPGRKPGVSASSENVILHLIPHLRLGAGRFVTDLAVQQARLGRRVSVCVSPDCGGQWRTDPLLVGELARSGVFVDRSIDFFQRDLTSLVEAAAALRARVTTGSVVHAHTAPAALVGLMAGCRTVLTSHGVGIGRSAAFDRQDAGIIRLLPTVTTPSRYWAERLQALYGAATCEVVPVGLDLTRFVRDAGDVGDAPAPRVVVVSELTHRKGIDVLIAALPRVLAAHPGVELHVFGTGDREAALHEQLRASIGRNPQAVFRGSVERPYARLRRGDVFVLPSRSDNQPVALIEAMLMGLPAVVTAVGGQAELVDASGAGLVVPPEDPGALADALVSLLSLTHEDRIALGRRASGFARQRFDIVETAGAFDRLYRLSASLARAATPEVQLAGC